MRSGAKRRLQLRIGILGLGVLVSLLAVPILPAANAETYVYEQQGSPEGNLYVQEDEEEVRRLPLFGSYPSLAPDGRRIVYAGGGAKPGIMMTDIYGHGPREIRQWPAGMYGHFDWAPDGSELIVSNGDILSFHPSAEGWEWDTDPIVGWAGEQIEPTIAPNGEKIAFFSYTNTAGEPLGANGPALFLADRDGSNVEQLTFGEHIGLEPTFSPDSSKIAFYGFDVNDTTSEIYSLTISSKSVTALTNNSVNDTGPDWRADNRIGFSRSPLSVRVMDADGKNDELLKSFSEWTGAPSWAEIQGDLPTLGPETKEEATELLRRYAPKLRYDTQEVFPTMTANTITDVYLGGIPEESNRLIREEGQLIAYADPELSEPRLSLDFLQPPSGEYPNGKKVDGDDRLSQHGNGAEDAAEDVVLRFYEHPDYDQWAYGRAKYDGGRWWLQYWFWSYYQPFLFGFGDHEGDWEMIQIGVNESGLPDLATYAQHSGAESCSWTELRTSIGYYGNLAPDVFVAWGTHASYPDSGAVDVPDFTDAEVPVAPRIDVMKDAADWVEWPGVWGDSASSPAAPSTQGAKWNQPDDFYEEASECDTSLLAASTQESKVPANAKLPEARLDAERIGDVVRVSYEVPGDGGPRPERILVTVADPKGAQIGRTVRLVKRRGRISISAPFDQAPLVVRARTLSPEYQSDISEAEVR